MRHITCYSACAASDLEQRLDSWDTRILAPTIRQGSYVAHPVQRGVWSSVEERGGGESALKLFPTYAKDGYMHQDLERRPKVKSSLACPCESKAKVGYGRAASSDFSIHVQLQRSH